MAPPQGTSSYPGILHPKSGVYTVLHGIDPGIIRIDAALQESPAAPYGDVYLRYGTNQIPIRDCRLNSATTQRYPEGLITSFEIQDRRWKWKFGEVYGHYNIREKVATINKISRATPQELAKILLGAMGEQGYDISQLPNGVQGPEVQWDGSNPAQELLHLCSQFGCRVVFNPITNKVSIQRAGNGSNLPQIDSVESPSSTISAQGAPSSIRFLCAPTRFQAPIKLEAVGIDTDGVVKSINNLSYAPSGGWGKENLVFSSLSNEKERELAEKTVFRWYRVSPNLKITTPNSVVEVRDRFQIFNLSDSLNETEVTPESGVTPKRGYVEGVYWLRNIGYPINSPSQKSTTDSRLVEEFRVIEDQNVIEFTRQVKKWDESGEEWVEAELYFTGGFNVRDRFTFATHRYGILYNFNLSSRTGPEVVLREDVTLKVTDQGSPGSFSGGQWTDNLDTDQIREQAEFYSKQAAQKYLIGSSSEAQYQEIVPIHVDGKIQSVIWQWDDFSGATTRATVNTEPDLVETKYEGRTKFNRMKRALGVT